MQKSRNIRRLAAFTESQEGGNPAGVWLGDQLPQPDVMQSIAAKVGYSETVFIAPIDRFTKNVRYYSPLAEVSFCGHATIAAGVCLGQTQGLGTYTFNTKVGGVLLEVSKHKNKLQATLTSVETQQRDADEDLLNSALKILQWKREGLDSNIPPTLAYAGAWHLILAVRDLNTLNQLNYDFERLKNLMLHEGLTTLQLICRVSDHLFHARNPFPVGGVIEDPATGAAAAALGGYLRDAKLEKRPLTSRFTKENQWEGRASFSYTYRYKVAYRYLEQL